MHDPTECGHHVVPVDVNSIPAGPLFDAQRVIQLEDLLPLHMAERVQVQEPFRLGGTNADT